MSKSTDKAIKILRARANNIALIASVRAKCSLMADRIESQILVGDSRYDIIAEELSELIITAQAKEDATLSRIKSIDLDAIEEIPL